MEESQQQMLRVDNLALQHLGLKHAEFYNAVGQIADRNITHPRSTLKQAAVKSIT